MTSSGMTHAWAGAKEAGPNRLGELVTENHFGLIDVDWAARRLRLSIQNLAGVNVRLQDIELQQLQKG
jgi:alkaline phosphatase D